MEQKLRALEQSNEDMKRQMEALRQQQEATHAAATAAAAQPAIIPPTTPAGPEHAMVPDHAPQPTHAPAQPEGFMNPMGVPVTFSASLTLRYDYWKTSDLTDQLINDRPTNAMRARVRFGVEFGDKKSDLVIAGIRWSTGENPNPTVPFVSLGNGFRETTFGISQAWVAIRPFQDRSRLQFILGRMANPLWRGTTGTIRTEMLWDDDINPHGITMKATLIKLGKEALGFKLENVAGYYQIEETVGTRFVGKVGNTSLIVDQLTASMKYATAAVSFIDFENLNAGLSSPAVLNEGRSVQVPTNAFLARPGFQLTNNRFGYGPQSAIGFSGDSFRILNPTAQVHIPIEAPKLGNPEVALLIDYAHNFSARKSYRDGISGTLSTRIGDYTENSKLNPLNAWFTYRYVQADTTLATFADSDLGGGTGYKGMEAGASYRITKHLMPAISYFNYYGFPRMENHAQRVFFDITGEF
jgi:hypothetical protein